jgi:hypothetical protein
MSDFLLHEDAQVQCIHSGNAKPTQTVSNVKVSGKAIVTQTSIYNIQGCLQPPQSGGPDLTALWTSAATRIKAGGMPVLLKGSQSKCAPTTTALVIISTQTRVKGT